MPTLETICKQCGNPYALTLPDLAKGASWWALCPDCRPPDESEAA